MVAIRPQGGNKRNQTLSKPNQMRANYDFARGVKNPYVKRLKKQFSIRIGRDVIQDFSTLAAEMGITWQELRMIILRAAIDRGSGSILKRILISS